MLLLLCRCLWFVLDVFFGKGRKGRPPEVTFSSYLVCLAPHFYQVKSKFEILSVGPRTIRNHSNQVP